MSLGGVAGGMSGIGGALDVGELVRVAGELGDGSQAFRLLGRLWIFEEDLWLGSLHQAPLPVEHQLAVVADQLCVVMPVVRRTSAMLPDAQTLQNLYHALALQLGLPWQQLQWPPADEGAEGRARWLLFLLKTMHLHSLLRAFPDPIALLALQQSLPRQTTFVKQVRAIGRLQQIFLQTAAHADVLLLWRRGMLARSDPQQQEAFLRTCLLDVPHDEQDLFPFLAGVLRLSDAAILSLHLVLCHLHDYHLQLLTLLFRKPQEITLDAYCLAHRIPLPPLSRSAALSPAASLARAHQRADPLNLSQLQTSMSSTTVSQSPHLSNPSSASFFSHSAIASPSQSASQARVFSPSSARTDVIISILKQPPRETIKDKILNPVPAIRIDGLREGECEAFVVRVSLVRYGETQEVDDGIQGVSIQQVPSNRQLTFKKIKLKHTCKQLDCTRVTLRFQLLKKFENGSFERTGVEALSDPVEVYSHTSQLNSSGREEGTPVVFGIVPDQGPKEGGLPAVLLGMDVNPGPNFVVVFGGMILRPIHAEVGWVIINIPPYHPEIGSPVSITISTDGGLTACDSACQYTYTG